MARKLIGVLAAWLLLGAPAAAHDSLAPPGAPHDWLPGEEWVARRWVPFDEQRLKAELGLRGRELEAYLYNDHRSLAQLARRRGIALDGLVARLLEPWGAGLEPERRAVLADRTRRVLTQGHLAQHVFFHLFHDAGLYSSSEQLFGVAPAEFSRLRRAGWTVLDMARAHGIDRATVTVRAAERLFAERSIALASRQAWQAQVDRVLARQIAALSCWLASRAPAQDRSNPYGKARLQHGFHAAGWPRTREQWRADDARTERVRANLRPGCWNVPPAWDAPSP